MIPASGPMPAGLSTEARPTSDGNLAVASWRAMSARLHLIRGVRAWLMHEDRSDVETHPDAVYCYGYCNVEDRQERGAAHVVERRGVWMDAKCMVSAVVLRKVGSWRSLRFGGSRWSLWKSWKSVGVAGVDGGRGSRWDSWEAVGVEASSRVRWSRWESAESLSRGMSRGSQWESVGTVAVGGDRRR